MKFIKRVPQCRYSGEETIIVHMWGGYYIFSDADLHWYMFNAKVYNRFCMVSTKVEPKLIGDL